MATKIVAICGSFRAGSFNRKLLAVGVKELEKAGAEVDVVDLKALQIPVYDGDIEGSSGIPQPAQQLRERIAAANGLFICSPEYNHSIPGGLKNVIDWCSRPPKQPFTDKVCAIAGASSGHFGTVRMQAHLRQTMTALGTWLLPGSFMLPMAQNGFDAEGNLKVPELHKSLAALMTSLLTECQRRS
jgi:chromate reductase